MTKEEALKKAQEKLAEASTLLDEAAQMANEHRFDLSFLGAVYVPEGATEEESEENGWPIKVNYEIVEPGEWWMPSTC